MIVLYVINLVIHRRNVNTNYVVIVLYILKNYAQYVEEKWIFDIIYVNKIKNKYFFL